MKLVSASNFILLLCIWAEINAQTLNLDVVCKLPDALRESSALWFDQDERVFYSLNDSDRKNEFHSFDSTGAWIATYPISNATNIDWEEMTADEEGTLYIGDFGNNSNNRQDLKIYILPHFFDHKDSSIHAEIIRLKYERQSAFPPPDASKNFDMEAMVYFNDSLHLFSKNRTTPYTGIAYHYTIPAQAGDYTLLPRDSFNTGGTNYLQNWVVGAALSPDKKSFILLSYDKMWLFRSFVGSSFLQGNVTQYKFPFLSQKEGVSFSTNSDIFISEESVPGASVNGNLYHAKLDLTSTQEQGELKKNVVNTRLISDNYLRKESLEAEIYNLSGQLIMRIAPHDEVISFTSFPAGVYFMKENSKFKSKTTLLIKY